MSQLIGNAVDVSEAHPLERLTREDIEALYSPDCIIPDVCVYMSKERFATIVLELINK